MPTAAIAFARAVNDWQVEQWDEKEPRLRASIVVPSQLPLYAGGAWDVAASSIALGLAAVTAGLRVAADQHYLSDVVVCSALGLFSGMIVPAMLFG